MSGERSADEMSEFCHRCGAELAAREWAGEGGFFCPHCGAPQILMPEHLRVQGTEPEQAGVPAATSGVVAPPMPKEIHWRTAIRYGALVAGVGGVLTGVGTVSGLVSVLGFLWVVSGGVIALGFYQKHKPAAKISVRVGFRIGVVTGLLMTVALAVAMAAAGITARFGLHRMGEFDGQMDQNARNVQTWFHDNLPQKGGDQKGADQEEDRLLQYLSSSPEFRAGEIVFGAGLQAMFLILLSAGGGAFAGRLGTRRQGARDML